MSTGISYLDETWNTVAGCSHVHSGCAHCWAERMAWRLACADKPDYQGLHEEAPDGSHRWNGTVRCLPHKLDQPRHWKRPRVIGVNFMADTFHEAVPDLFIDRILKAIWDSPQHRFQVLTKRSARMRQYMDDDYPIVLPRFDNLALGVSCSTQDDYDKMVAALIAIRAACRIVSLEPLLGSIVLHTEFPGFANLHGIIVGGESGPGARPMHPDWARSIRDQCAEAEIPFYFKQWGEWLPDSQVVKYSAHYPGFAKAPFGTLGSDGQWKPNTWSALYDQKRGGEMPNVECMYRVGVKRAGHLLDGREYRELPAFFDLKMKETKL